MHTHYLDSDPLEESPSLWRGDEVLERDETRLIWPADLISDEPQTMASARPPAGPPDSELSPEEVLQRYWGYSSFRERQRDIIESVLDGRDTLGLLPTGGGKSICFQVPGLMLPGITLVITPLISLMKDQVDHLRARGIKAAAIHSGMNGYRIQQTIDNCIHGRYKFLYISPERLASERFRRQIEGLDIGLLVIDECHCICQWGYDFRPSYLNILDLKTMLPSVPWLALTATATPEVIEEIHRLLDFGTESRTITKSFYRPNLSYSIRRTEEKEQTMLYILERVPGSAIVYCRNRELCKQVSDFLCSQGVKATYFHAGLTHAERELRQNRWMRGEMRVMVATNAFGMGIDKPDVRLVLHLTMPSSLEEYFQEAGRAGRDGERSYAVALIEQDDAAQLERRVANTFPPIEYIQEVYEVLCNYLGIGEGEGYGHSYDFDYDDFVRTCHMHPIATKPAIQIMEIANWLSCHEDDAYSRLMFTYTREQLYNPEVGHDKLLRSILRLYTGLFSGYVFISESDIAASTGYTLEEVYRMLRELTRLGVLVYIPRKHVPRLVFRVRREDARLLLLPRSAYHDRRERMQERIAATVRYISDQTTCRSRLLLEYFGEQSHTSCGKCDVCLARVNDTLRHYIVEDTRRTIERLLAQPRPEEMRLELSELYGELPYDADEILLAVRYLLAESDSLHWQLVGNLFVPTARN